MTTGTALSGAWVGPRPWHSGARTTKAFAWGRKVPDTVTLLRLVLAYCLGQWSLHSTASWAATAGFADISTSVPIVWPVR